MHQAPLAIAAVLGITAGVAPVVIGSLLQHVKLSRHDSEHEQESVRRTR